jgi:hypothetical protein
MLTFEDVTGYFLKAATSLALTTHPEHWLNTRTLEREFTCACHVGTCEEAETSSACAVSFSWTTLDTALSFDGPAGICEFFHETDEQCSHLQTSATPPLVVDLSYSLPLNDVAFSEEALLSLTQNVRLRASEHSRRTVETRPGISMALQHNRLSPDMLTLQQRVELPIWHPEGIRSLLDSSNHWQGEENAYGPDYPRPQDWLPRAMVEVCEDIVQVLAALDAALSYNQSSNL